MTPDTAALRALADAAEQEAREEAQRIAEYRRRKWFEPRWDWQNVTARSALAEALRDPDTVRGLCDAADEVEQLRCAHCGEVGCDWIGDIHKARAETAEAALYAARADLAALVADLRIYATTGIGVATLRALLDRHAPETTTED